MRQMEQEEKGRGKEKEERMGLQDKRGRGESREGRREQNGKEG